MAMKIFGHRGCSYLPENTLAAFAEARKHTDAVELDVYYVDGRVIVIHDSTLRRTTDGVGEVMDYTFEQLRTLNAGTLANVQQIPTLQEVLETVGSNTLVNVELKGSGTADPVAKIIHSYVRHKTVAGWGYNDFIVSSFDHPQLAQFKAACSDVKIGVLYCGIPVDLAAGPERMGAHSINLDCDFISQELVDDAHARGLKVYVYTVNTQKVADRLKAMGVDGVFTNFPNEIKG